MRITIEYAHITLPSLPD